MVEPKFCWSCGHPVQPGYGFCEACGAELIPLAGKSEPQGKVTGAPAQKMDQDNAGFVTPSNAVAPAPTAPMNQYGTGSLFDMRRDLYVMHEKYWDWGSGDILDEKGTVIGKMHRVIFSLRARIELKELDGTISAQIHRKLAAIRPTYDLKDPQDIIIGRLRKAILNVIHPKIWLEDALGNKILEARGSFMRYDFVVYDMMGKVVAEINMLNRWKEFFLGGGLFDFTDRYGIRIIDKTVDRRVILGFCIAIDNSMHDRPHGNALAIGPFHIGGGHGHWGGASGHRGPWHFGPF
jgi:uncharacterized protein YxjI